MQGPSNLSNALASRTKTKGFHQFSKFYIMFENLFLFAQLGHSLDLLKLCFMCRYKSRGGHGVFRTTDIEMLTNDIGPPIDTGFQPEE